MIGNVPDGWRVEKLVNLSNILDGDRGKNYPKQEDFSDKDYCLFLTTKNVSKKGFNFDSTQFISKSKDEILRKGRLERNDLVITTRGTVGNIAFFNQDVPFDIIRINSGMAIIRITTKDLSYSFVNTYLKGDIFYRYVTQIISGSAQPQITITKLKNLTIPIPPLPQQEKIVKVLDISSQLIEKQELLIKEYDLFLKSKFIEMFGDPIKNPMGWNFSILPNLVAKPTMNGLYVPKEEYIDGVYEMIHMSDAFYGKASSGSLKKVKLTDRYFQKYKLTDDDLLITRRSLTYEGAAKPCLIETKGENLVFESSLIRVSLDILKMLPLFLYYYLSCNSARKKHLLKYVTKSTISGINQSNLNKVKILTPPIVLQNKFAKIVEKIETIKTQETKKLEHLQTLHKSLMDKAFKGEIK